MAMAAQIRTKLEEAFAPTVLELVDESELHRGHGGWREGGETHFRLRLRAAAFDGQGRVARQRAVHAVLRDELAGPVHALSLDLGGATDP
ncbi:MAG: BolA family protein [Pseudomonadota bacterium]